MDVDLGDADGAVAVAFSVLSDFLAELQRIGRLPRQIQLQRDVNGQPSDVTVIIDPPSLELANDGTQWYTRLAIRGIIEVRPAGQPDADPLSLPLNAGVRLVLELVGDDRDIGMRYDGPDGVPGFPVTGDDLDEIFTSPEVTEVLGTTIPLTAAMVQGLNESRFPDENSRPSDRDWSAVLTLMPSRDDTVDSFAVTAAPPGSEAAPAVAESFVAQNMGLAVAYNRGFLDLLLGRGAAGLVGTTVEEAEVRSFELRMTDMAIGVFNGHLVRPVRFAPDVDIYIDGPIVPLLVRGTTAMTFNVDNLNVDVDDTDEIFYEALKWVLTVGAAALLFTGSGILTALGITLWATLVQRAWDADVDIEGAPNAVRNSLATQLGAHLSALAASLDDDTAVPPLQIDATPDSVTVVNGHMIVSAQIFVVPLQARLRSAEYSSHLRRFAIYELVRGRRFRAQELARLVASGKITVPGFHDVDGDHLQADPDQRHANNLLEMFRENETRELAVRNVRT